MDVVTAQSGHETCWQIIMSMRMRISMSMNTESSKSTFRCHKQMTGIFSTGIGIAIALAQGNCPKP